MNNSWDTLSTSMSAVATAEEHQVGGDHYMRLTVEPWDAMQSWLTHDEFVGFLKGNILKYIARANYKHGAEDIKKAAHYQRKLTSVMELEL